MEKRIRGAVVILMVLGMAIGQCSSSTFGDCYKGCFLICIITPGGSIFACGSKCLKDCIWPNHSSLNSLHDNQLTQFFCNYGCASSLCTRFSSINDPGEEKVEKCVNSCSVRCIKNYRT